MVGSGKLEVRWGNCTFKFETQVCGCGPYTVFKVVPSYVKQAFNFRFYTSLWF